MAKTVSYNAGSIIFFQGDRDDNIYIVQSGIINTKSIDMENGSQVMETLRAGEFFGVKSALSHSPRTITASTAVDSVVVVISVQEFEKIFSTRKDVTEKMLKVFSKTLRDLHSKIESIMHNDVVSIGQDAGMLMVAKAFYDSEEYVSCISVLTRLLTAIPEPANKPAVIKLLEDAKRGAVQSRRNEEQEKEDNSQKDASLMQFSSPVFDRFTKDFKKGEVIVSEFEPGDTFYLIKKGDVQIVKCITGQNKNLDILKSGEFFGEMAIIDRQQRSASCVARTDVSVLEFNKENFQSLVLGNPHLVMNLLKLFSRRICDQQRKISIILIQDLQIRLCDVFLMYDETLTSPQDKMLMGGRRTFKVTVNDVAHWAGISVNKADEELARLAEKNKIQLFDDKINVMNIHDMRRIVDAYYSNLDSKLK